MVEGNQEYGIAVGSGSNHNISGNQILNNGRAGIQLGNVATQPGGGGGGDGIVEKNIIKGNGADTSLGEGSFSNGSSFKGGVYVETNNWTVQDNNIYGNSGDYDFYYNGDEGSDLTVSRNWWGTSSLGEVQALTYDFNDNITKGEIIYDSNLSSSAITAPPAPPANLAGQAGQRRCS